MKKQVETQVCIIGGGATGAGIFRDMSLRGIPAILIEKNDLATGTSGRNHGLLHSGARYAVKDRESAVECIQENEILKKIGKHCTEDTGGLFIALDDVDLEYSDTFFQSCQQCGIPIQELTLDQAFRMEKHLNPKLKRAFMVPDGSVDPFRLTLYNAWDAIAHGGQLFTYCELQNAHIKNKSIEYIEVWDKEKNETFAVRAQYYINAAGPWAGIVAARVQASMPMAPSMGVMVILDYRIVNHVINRMRLPADGDIIVPGDTVSIIGTTSRLVTEDQLDHLEALPGEVTDMVTDASEMIPEFGQSRMLRYYSGARPLPKLEGATGREVSRNFTIKDHSQKDQEPDNLYSIVGGKLMTYRLMAQAITDQIAPKIGNDRPCLTAKQDLPPVDSQDLRQIGLSIRNNYGVQTGVYRQGQKLADSLAVQEARLVCECEMVTENELLLMAEQDHITNISDLRRRTRLGMGPCQGTLCAMRTMEMNLFAAKDFDERSAILENFIQERWKGIRHILWGDSLRMEEFAMWLYHGVWGWE